MYEYGMRHSYLADGRYVAYLDADATVAEVYY